MNPLLRLSNKYCFTAWSSAIDMRYNGLSSREFSWVSMILWSISWCRGNSSKSVCEKMSTMSAYACGSLWVTSSSLVASVASSHAFQSWILRSISLSVIENIVAPQSWQFKWKLAADISPISIVACSLSLQVTVGVGVCTRGSYDGMKQSIRTCHIVQKALQVSIIQDFLPCNFGNQVCFSSFSRRLAGVASLPTRGGVVVSSCSIGAREISASGWSCCLRMHLPSCHLLSSWAIVASLHAISLQIALGVVWWTRSLWAICMICMNEGVGVFLRGHINLWPATSRLTQKYSNHIWPRITSWAPRFKTINGMLYWWWPSTIKFMFK